MKIMHSLLLASFASFSAATFAAENLFVDSATVLRVQKTLADRGYRTGSADGRMGPQTQAAVRNFQKAESLEPTGQLNRQTLVALGIQKPDGNVALENERYERSVVRKVQQTLNARGFKAGPDDGVLSERTSVALRQFQRSENLDDTGRLNARTLAALGLAEQSAASGSSRPVNGDGASASVRAVQRRLMDRGFLLKADGVMGPATRKALMDYQQRQNLEVTGRIDRRTLAALGLGDSVAASR
jgi:peptidoglycan hydrolase-like protein with peptidoglycan-binding domain